MAQTAKINVSRILSHLGEHGFEKTAESFDVSLGKLHSIVTDAAKSNRRLPSSLLVISR